MSINPKQPAKNFCAFVIWDYAENNFKIVEITQSIIQDAIFDLHSDDNWGDPSIYDLNIKKEGQKLDTMYKVIPVPPKPLPRKSPALMPP